MLKICENYKAGKKFLEQGNLSDAEVHFQKALDRDPGFMEARFQLGNLLYLREKVVEAIEQYQYILEQCPDLLPVLLNLGQAYRKLHRYDDAEACYNKILMINPDHREALFSQANILLDKGRVEEAILRYSRVTHFFPDFIEAHFKLGIAYRAAGQLDNALTSFHTVLKINPQLPHVYNHIGMVHKAKNDFSQAETSYQEALLIDVRLHDVHNNLGTLYMETGRIDDAAECFKKALSLRPDYVEVIHNLGNAVQAMGRYDKAIELYKEAIKIKPEFSSAYYHCGIAYQNLKKPQTAIAYYEKALSIKPNWGKVIYALYHQCQQICDWQRLKELDPVIDSMTSNALERGETPTELPFLSIVRKQNPSENHAIAKAWSLDLSKRYAAFNRPHRPYSHPAAGEPLTVGYVSNRFRNAPTAQLMMGLFSAHDRKCFRIHCYSYGPDDGSIYRRRIADECDEFVDISSMSYTQTAERIQRDKVHILMDLKGFTRNSRLGIFALRPAPIQVSYLGFPGTTGSDFMDYIIADRIIIPERQACHYSEKMVYLPHCYMASDDKRIISTKKWRRTDFMLPDRAIVLCSFNMAYKISSSLFDAWMKILQEIPRSVLWLLRGDPAYEKNLRDEAVVRGVDPSRIIFSPKLPIEEHLSRHRLADLALDTWTCNGHTTTSDALWAGIPVLTLKGGHFVSRVSASLLTAVGMEMLIADNKAQYIDIALNLLKNPDQLDLLKKRLVRNISLKPLFNTRNFTKNLEYAYLSMWSNYVAGHAPQAIHVPDQRA